MTIALIDGDVVAYMAAFAAQRNVYHVDKFDSLGNLVGSNSFVLKDEAIKYQNDLLSFLGNENIRAATIRKEVIAESPELAEICARQIIMKVLGDTKATQYKLFLTSPDKSNFRYKIAKTKPYKGNRKNEKPVHYNHIRNYLHLTWEGYVVVGEEADDYISINQCENLIRDDKGIVIDSKTITATIDKDILNQIPGKHYNLKTAEQTLVTEDNAMRFFWKQMLMGDTVDNIQGVPRFGKKKSNRLIDGCKTLEECREAVEKVYQDYYKEKWKEVYIEMGNLLWIKREANIIFEDLKL